MLKKSGTKEFQELVNRVKKQKNITPKELEHYLTKALYSEKIIDGLVSSGTAKAIGVSEKIPEICYLLGIYAALHGKGIPDDIEINIKDLQKWLIYWLEGHLEHDIKSKTKRAKPFEIDKNYLNKWIEAINELKASIGDVKICNSKLPTLDYFPDAFTPLTIITGTGLAVPPEKISDLFRDSTRLTDLFFLNQLNLPKETRIVSDRLVIDMNREDRIKHFGNSHLLLIGGPKVNAVTRKFCKHGFFRFQFQNEEKNFQDFYDSLNNEDVRKNVFPNANCVKMFYELLENPKLSYDIEHFKETVQDENIRKRIHQKSVEITQKLGESDNLTYEDIVKIFVPTQLIDPISNRCHASKATTGKDFTMITIAPNFYNRDISEKASFQSYKHEYVSVIVSGIDRLGTASGVKKLSQPETFATHPIGGFLEAVWGNSSLDFEKYDESYCSWSNKLTPQYTIEDFIEKIKNFKSSDKDSALQRISEADDLDKKGLESYLKFLEMFQ